LFDTNLATEGPQMRLIGSVVSKDCFHSVAWGCKGIGDGSLSHGVIAGGMSDGSLNLWSARAILDGQQQQAQLARTEVHRGQVGVHTLHSVKHYLPPCLCIQIHSLISSTTFYGPHE
jgi:hypothetical protein